MLANIIFSVVTDDVDRYDEEELLYNIQHKNFSDFIAHSPYSKYLNGLNGKIKVRCCKDFDKQVKKDDLGKVMMFEIKCHRNLNLHISWINLGHKYWMGYGNVEICGIVVSVGDRVKVLSGQPPPQHTPDIIDGTGVNNEHTLENAQGKIGTVNAILAVSKQASIKFIDGDIKDISIEKLELIAENFA